MSAILSVQLDAVQGLAAELAVLAADLAGDAALCRSTAMFFGPALGGEEGWTAAEVAAAWSDLTGVVADRADAVAGTLLAAVAAYRAEDTALAERIGSSGREYVPVAR
jgi:hypothetical protein